MSSTTSLLLEARRVLGFSQRELGKLLSVTERTVQRWDAQQSDPGHVAMCKVATAVHPLDPALAARIAAHAGTNLEALGVAPSPAPPPVRAPAPSLRSLVDAVVCAAADTLSAPPATVRPVLASALRKASGIGLTLDDVLSVLAPAPPAPAAARPARSTHAAHGAPRSPRPAKPRRRGGS